MAVDMTKLVKLQALDSLASLASAGIAEAKSTAADGLKKVLVFDSETYVGATNPNLDGKPVLVLAVKTTQANGTTSTAYSFLNLYDLVDIYTIKVGDSAKVLTINGKEIEFKISSTAGNIISADANGLYATTRVAGAVQGNVAIFDANGAPADSGIGSATVVTTSMIATDAEVNEVLGNYFTLS